MNRYQSCLYLFECIFHGNSKYSNEINYYYYLFENVVSFDDSSQIVDLSSITPAAWNALRGGGGWGGGSLLPKSDILIGQNNELSLSVTNKRQQYNTWIRIAFQKIENHVTGGAHLAMFCAIIFNCNSLLSITVSIKFLGRT